MNERVNLVENSTEDLSVRQPSGTVMRLVSNIPVAQMEAKDILALHGRRWQIECFFRWIK